MLNRIASIILPLLDNDSLSLADTHVRFRDLPLRLPHSFRCKHPLIARVL